jgi:hypothetical protein
VFPNGNTEAYNKKKRKKNAETKRLAIVIYFFVGADQTSPRQHQSSFFSKINASNKGTMRKHHYKFSHRRLSALTKEYLQQGHFPTE